MHEEGMAMRRQKPRTFGQLKTRYVFTKGARRGEVVEVRPTRRDSMGRPIFGKKTMVRVFVDRARRVTEVMEARLAVRKMDRGQIPLQQLRLVGERA